MRTSATDAVALVLGYALILGFIIGFLAVGFLVLHYQLSQRFRSDQRGGAQRDRLWLVPDGERRSEAAASHSPLPATTGAPFGASPHLGDVS